MNGLGAFISEKMIICPRCHKQNIGFHINALYCKECGRIFTSKEGEEAGKLKVRK
jgi:transposase-like protein